MCWGKWSNVHICHLLLIGCILRTNTIGVYQKSCLGLIWGFCRAQNRNACRDYRQKLSIRTVLAPRHNQASIFCSKVRGSDRLLDWYCLALVVHLQASFEASRHLFLAWYYFSPTLKFHKVNLLSRTQKLSQIEISLQNLQEMPLSNLACHSIILPSNPEPNQ